MSRARLAAALAVLVPLGFGTKVYGGPGAAFVRAYLGGFLYVVFWIWSVLLFFPRLAPRRAAAGVFLATCALEALQLWHPAWLERLRAGWLGAALLGATFSWGDFAAYLAAAVAGAASARFFAPSRA